MYQIQHINFTKDIKVEKNLSIKTLRKILDEQQNYIFSLIYPSNDRFFSYGFKRTTNFKTDKNINYLWEKILLIKKKMLNRGKSIYKIFLI